METKTLVVPESKGNTLVIPTSLAARLKGNASLIITSAQKHGAISTREIAAILRPGNVSDRNQLKSTLELLNGFLTGIGLSLARGQTDLEKRLLPLPTPARRAYLNLEFGPIKETDIQLLKALQEDNQDYEYSEFGLYREVTRRFPLLDYKQTVELFKKRAEGDLEAHYRLILHNLKLVFHWAFKFQNRGLDLSDLIQEGILGLLRAVEGFDWTRGFQLSTYASQWIRAKIDRAVKDKGRTIRLPVHFSEKHRLMLNTADILNRELGRDATHEEIGKRLNLPTRLISKMFRVIQASETGSIDEMVSSDDGEYSQHKAIADAKAVSPSSTLEAKEALEETVAEVRSLLIKLATLPSFDERYSKIFRMRYGLDGTFFARPTLEDCGNKFGVTRERIRQIVLICWQRLNEAGIKGDEDWFIAKLNQIEELESVTGTLAKI